MTSTTRLAIGGWLRGRAENVAVALIATMFVCFLLQIVFRYLLNRPLGWTEEVTVLCWVWVVLWGAAFILSDEEEIRFDIIYGVVPERCSPGLHRDHRHRIDPAPARSRSRPPGATWRS